MRLIDEIQAAAGSAVDSVLCGSFTSMARELTKAQCFELAPEVVEACGYVATSKPSSLLSAMPMTRLPYPHTWIEWQPYAQAAHYLGGTTNPKRPTPVRMGCLFEAISADHLAQGTMNWAWAHAGNDLMVLPYSVQFDWRADGNVLETVDQAADIMVKMPPELVKELRQHGLNPDADSLRRYVNKQRLDPSQAGKALRHAKQAWRRLEDNVEEQVALIRLSERAIAAPNIHCFGLWAKLNQMAESAAFKRLVESWAQDLEGEPDFAMAFMIMLNAKAALERTPDDFSRLNRRRILAGKKPLHEFVMTRLAVSTARGRHAAKHGLSRADARKHLVRGHFKTRTSGIYWWSPHVRGKGEAVMREGYKVTS